MASTKYRIYFFHEPKPNAGHNTDHKLPGNFTFRLVSETETEKKDVHIGFNRPHPDMVQYTESRQAYNIQQGRSSLTGKQETRYIPKEYKSKSGKGNKPFLLLKENDAVNRILDKINEVKTLKAAGEDLELEIYYYDVSKVNGPRTKETDKEHLLDEGGVKKLFSDKDLIKDFPGMKYKSVVANYNAAFGTELPLPKVNKRKEGVKQQDIYVYFKCFNDSRKVERTAHRKDGEQEIKEKIETAHNFTRTELEVGYFKGPKAGRDDIERLDEREGVMVSVITVDGNKDLSSYKQANVVKQAGVAKELKGDTNQGAAIQKMLSYLQHNLLACENEVTFILHDETGKKPAKAKIHDVLSHMVDTLPSEIITPTVRDVVNGMIQKSESIPDKQIKEESRARTLKSGRARNN